MKRSIWGICLAGIMAAIIGTVGIFGVMTMHERNRWSFEYNTEAMLKIAKVLEYTQVMKALPYMLVYEVNEPDYEQRLAEFETYSNDFEVYIVDVETRIAFDELKNTYYNAYLPALFAMLDYTKWGEDRDQLTYFLESMTAAADKMIGSADRCLNLVYINAQVARDTDEYAAQHLSIIIIVLVALEIVLSVIFIIAVARYKRAKHPANNQSYPFNPAPPVYAMYPVDPSNPSNPPHATHILYPVVHPVNPPQADESQRY